MTKITQEDTRPFMQDIAACREAAVILADLWAVVDVTYRKVM